jgi:uncharacterized membrane protein
VLAVWVLGIGVAELQAAVTVKACNESSTGAWIALGYDAGDKAKWVTTGWWWTDPQKCIEPVELSADVDDVYVYANNQGDDVEWLGTKSLCMSMEPDFEYDEADTRACSETRAFKKYAVDASRSVNVTLRDEDSVRVAYNFTLCNDSEEYVNAALGTASATDASVSSDGWYGIESGQCETFVRRGRSDSAYFYAQTPSRRLIWHGDTPLCTRYHQDFTLAGADGGQCADGDSERLPFVKKPLAKGLGTHTLTVGNARTLRYALTLCNSYASDVYAAIAHLDAIWMNGTVARGFWRLRPGECRLVDAVGASPVYVYAETESGEKVWQGRDLNACVRDAAFTLPRVERYPCDGNGDRRTGFVAWPVTEGANVYKFQ